jgi:NitT/TauT family transport system permease protein
MHFRVRTQISSRTDTIIGLAGIGVLLLGWCVLSYGNFVEPLFLPRPTDIWQGIVDFYKADWLFPAIWRSFWRVTKALLLAVLIGAPIGVVMGAFTPVDAFFRKIVNGAKSVPTTGILGLVILWFGLGEKGKVAFLFLGAIFYMIIMVKNAVLGVTEDYIRVALDVGANRWQVVSRVLVPGALPKIWDAVAVCNGIMWTYIVLAEFINSSAQDLGLGYLLFLGGRTQEPGKVFGTLIIIAMISSLTDFLLLIIRRRFLNW